MIDSEQISNIMTELGLDPSNQEVRKTVERLVAAKPQLPMNDKFFAQLREDLQMHAAQTLPKKSIINLTPFFMNKILASALVVMIVVAAGGFWYIQNRTDQPLFQSPAAKQANQLLSGKFDVSEAPEESFGDLNKVSIVNATDVAKLNASNKTNTTAELMATAKTEPAAGGSMAVSMGDDSKLFAPGEPYPAPESYNFTYGGKDIAGLLEKTQPVLKRRTPTQVGGIADRIVSLLSFGLIDLTKFSNLKVQYISFVEDRDYGYGLNVDLVQGIVNISQNWERWPQFNSYQNPEGERYTIDTYPKDDEIIKIAEGFLNEYGISREAYGQPEVVDNNWRILYENARAEDKVNFYFPEQTSVIYPLILEGKRVYDEGGNPNGLNVMVDVRQKRALGLYDLTTKQFERSTYTGETDASRILQIATNGGFRNPIYVDPNSKLITLQLDTPSLQMEKIWYSSIDPKTGQYTNGGELYVPALVFPIKNQGNYWRKNVIVPLVKDILDTEVSQPQPLPVDLPAADAPVSTMSTSMKGNN